jgi:hypothetical protein
MNSALQADHLIEERLPFAEIDLFFDCPQSGADYGEAIDQLQSIVGIVIGHGARVCSMRRGWRGGDVDDPTYHGPSLVV